MSKKTVTMRFGEDKWVNGVRLYIKGEKCEIAPESVERWIKRGGVIVAEEIALPEPEPVQIYEHVPPEVEEHFNQEDETPEEEPVKRFSQNKNKRGGGR